MTSSAAATVLPPSERRRYRFSSKAAVGLVAEPGAALREGRGAAREHRVRRRLARGWKALAAALTRHARGGLPCTVSSACPGACGSCVLGGRAVGSARALVVWLLGAART